MFNKLFLYFCILYSLQFCKRLVIFLHVTFNTSISHQTYKRERNWENQSEPSTNSVWKCYLIVILRPSKSMPYSLKQKCQMKKKTFRSNEILVLLFKEPSLELFKRIIQTKRLMINFFSLFSLINWLQLEILDTYDIYQYRHFGLIRSNVINPSYA